MCEKNMLKRQNVFREQQKGIKSAQSVNESHFFSFVTIGLSVINGGNDSFKTIEMQIIHTLGTLNPQKINERFTFN